MTRRTALAIGVVAAGIAAAVVATLPPRTLVLTGSVPANVAFGGYHIHSNRSDGTGTPDEIAAAAARAGLSFIILTDHGDATRPPDPPTYRHGVLTIDAVEINTDDGHLVGLGLGAASPYPLAGAARDVLEDVHRMGGWGVVAHPDSPRANLRWRAWNVPYDGVEWLNADSEWRAEPAFRWPGLLAHLFVRPQETVASIFTRPRVTLARWDAESRRRPIVGLAGLDAHARLVWWQESDGTASGRSHALVARPSYEDMFRTLAQAVVLDAPLGGDPRRDAAAILEALRAGRTFSIVRAFVSPGVLAFSAHAASGDVPMGGSVQSGGVPVTFHAAVAQPSNATVVLLQNGRTLATAAARLDYEGPTTPGAYRVEVRLPGFDGMPWLVSNPIYVDEPVGAGAAAERSGPDAEPAPVTRLTIRGDPGQWHVEKEPASTGAISGDGEALRLDYRLAAGAASGQYVAAATPVPSSTSVSEVDFTARADRPMRVSVQIKLAGGHEGDRWRRSIYVDATPRSYVIPLESFDPADRPTSQRPIATTLQTLLFVVDTLNTRPGSSGSIWISALSLAGPPPAVVR